MVACTQTHGPTLCQGPPSSAPARGGLRSGGVGLTEDCPHWRLARVGRIALVFFFPNRSAVARAKPRWRFLIGHGRPPATLAKRGPLNLASRGGKRNGATAKKDNRKASWRLVGFETPAKPTQGPLRDARACPAFEPKLRRMPNRGSNETSCRPPASSSCYRA